MFTTETNKNARRTNGKGILSLQSLVLRTAANFGIEPLSVEIPKEINPANIFYAIERVKQLVAARKRKPEHGQGAEFIHYARMGGVVFDETLVYPGPADLSVGTITDVSALANWGDVLVTGYNDIKYDVEVIDVDSILVDSATKITASQFSITGLTAETDYSVRVKTFWNGNSNYSAWSAYEDFTTDAAA